jgi:hypothetical protein
MQQRRELLEERRNEQSALGVRNGKPSGKKILAINRIVGGGGGITDIYFPSVPQ